VHEAWCDAVVNKGEGEVVIEAAPSMPHLFLSSLLSDLLNYQLYFIFSSFVSSTNEL
jgi:hypothetical protein